LRNLERIKEKRIEEWLKEQEEIADSGFTTGEVIKGIKPPNKNDVIGNR
jgi:hypothetical protein